VFTLVIAIESACRPYPRKLVPLLNWASGAGFGRNRHGSAVARARTDPYRGITLRLTLRTFSSNRTMV